MSSDPLTPNEPKAVGERPADEPQSPVGGEEDITNPTFERLMETSDFEHDATIRGIGAPLPRRKRPPQPQAFDLEELIAVGGFGEVWRGRQVSLGRPVALKRLRRDIIRRLQFDVGSLKRYEEAFSNEAIIAASLEHPNIVPIHELGIDEEGYPLLAMKLVRGKPWSRLIREEFNQPVKDFLARHLPILASVTQAVAFAHSRGVIHRDIKPSQIMVGEFGEVQLMDWGLALRLDDMTRGAAANAPHAASTPGIYQASLSTCGTIAFMAPEQATRAIADLSERTDVYLLGATLYYLLTGKPPRTAETSREALRLAIEGLIVPPAEMVAGREVPEQLATLAMSALEKDPAARPPTVEDFLAQLREAIMGRREDRRRSSGFITPVTISPGATAEDPPYEAMQRDSEDTAPLRPLGLSGASSALLEGMFHRVYLNLSAIGRLDLLVEVASDLAGHFLSIPPQLGEPEGVGRRRCEILCEAATVLLSQSRLELAEEIIDEVERQVRERLALNTEAVATREELANSLTLAARIAHRRGEEATAWRRAREARRIRETLMIETGQGRIENQLADSLLLEGYLLWQRGDFEPAMDRLAEARSFAELHLREFVGCHETQVILGRIWNNMAWVHRLQGRTDAALEAMQKSFSLNHKVMTATQGVMVNRVNWLWAMRSLALLHELCGQHQEALRLFGDSLELTRHLSDGDPGNRQRRAEMAFSLAGLGRNHLCNGAPQKAESPLREAASILLEIARSNPDQGRNIRDHLACQIHLGEALLEMGRLAESAEMGVTSLGEVRRCREEFGILPRDLIVMEARALLLQGRILLARGSDADAARALGIGCDLIEPLTRGKYTAPETAEVWVALLCLSERHEEAEPLAQWLRSIDWRGRDFLREVEAG